MNGYRTALGWGILVLGMMVGTGCQAEVAAPSTAPAQAGPVNRATSAPAEGWRYWPVNAVTAPATQAADRMGAEEGESAPATQATTQPATQPAGEHFAAERHRIVSEKDEIVSVLENGLVVIAKRVPSPAVSVRGYVHAGGVYEGKWLGGGLSHLLEHLVAGGSTRKRTEEQNRDLLQAIGNNSNAYTSEDQTAFFINTTPNHMAQAVDLLSDWLLGAKITEEEYRREYQVVQRELEMGKGEPQREFAYMVMMNRYRVSPARVPVIGYQAVIQGLSRDDVYQYYKQAYVPNNMVFSIAGNLDPEAMLLAVRKQVDDTPPGRDFSHNIAEEPEVVAPRTVVATMPKLGQAQVDLGFPTIKLMHPDLYALDLLSAVLSMGEGSLLVEEIRDKKQLVSGIETSSFTPDYAEGTFSIDMQLDTDKLKAARQAVLEVIEQVKGQGVDEQRLKRAKTLMKAGRVRGMQTAEDIASSLAGDFLSTGDVHFTDLYLERIEQVTSQQVQAVARKYFDTGKLLTTVMLPREAAGSEGLPKAEELVRPLAPATQPTTREASGQVTKIELDNGTTLLLKRISTTPLVAVHMYAAGGLTDEDEKTNGLGNLAMEMLPRGTTTRSAQEIAEFFDSIGGQLNTGCGSNTWFWTASFLKEDLDKGMAVLGDVVSHPAFDEKELGAMKQRILAAIEEQDADWTAQSMRYFKTQYFGPMKSPYQFQVIGTKENVPQFMPQQIKDWYEQRILKRQRVMAIYGDIDVRQAEQLARKYFGALPRGTAPATQSVTQPVGSASADRLSTTPQINIRAVEVQKTEQPLAGIVIGFDSRTVVGDEANFPLTVGYTMAAGYDYPTGYLFQVLRGQGLVYVVQAFPMPGRDKNLPGAFIALAGCDPKNVDEVVKLMLENIARLQGSDQDMTVDWFHRSKQMIVTSEAMSHETAAAQATTAALDELYGLGYDYHEKFPQRINAVTLGQVRNVADERLRSCVVTISTPQPEAVTIRSGEQTYKQFPPVELTPRGVMHDTGGKK